MGNQLFALQTRGCPYGNLRGFRAELRRNGIRYCRDRRPRRSVSCGFRFTLWNEILRSLCSLKDDRVKSTDRGDVQVDG